jgi:VanZ family protein
LHRVPFPLAGWWGEPIIVGMHRFQTVWLPVIACATLIFVLSGIPSLSSGLGGWDLVLRTIAHVSIYALLGALLLRAIEHELFAFLTGIAYAVSDEVHQHFVPGRSAAITDFGYDALGVLAGVALLRQLRS